MSRQAAVRRVACYLAAFSLALRSTIRYDV